MAAIIILAVGVLLICALSFKSIDNSIDRHDEILRDAEHEKY